MQSLHVRFIFQIQIPLHGDFQGGYSFKIASTGIGISITNQNSAQEYHYQVQIISCDGEKEFEATKSLIWAKRNPYILQTKENTSVEGLKLRLKIKHGVFDFRKQKKRAIRFTVSCVHSGTVVSRGMSDIYQLLPKKRKADDSEINDEVLVPISWSEEDVPYSEYLMVESMQHLNDQTELHSSDEERPLKRQRLIAAHEEQVSLGDSASPHATQNIAANVYGVNDSVEESPNAIQYYESQPSSYHVQIDHPNAMLYQEYLPEQDMLLAPAEDHQQYMVLYNGNAEVVGNFRALNFYKASDINIKEDIRLLVEDYDPRSAILKIDGVGYKFKPGTTHSTNKRFVGYIAQQIESVVPSAVQLIDGILHVDYESLIPYLSESIKQNYNDIEGLKSESDRISNLLDRLYTEFVSKQRHDSAVEVTKTTTVTRITRATASRARQWLIPVAALVFLISAAIGVFYFATSLGSNNTTLAPISPPAQSVPIPYRYPYHRDALMKFFTATNGSGWHYNQKWDSDESVCDWYGVYCHNDHIVAIHMKENNLVGTIPDEIGYIDTLERVNLALNYLQGTIPSSLWHLPRIEEIILSQNKKLTGTIPNRKLSTLKLDLGDCNIYGTIPPTLLYDTDSMFINLSSNALTGSIPPMGFTNTILALHLAHNNFTGAVPSLRVSNELDLSHNNLSGYFTMIRFTALKYLDVSHNQLNGLFWDEGEDEPRWDYVDISHNAFEYASFEHLDGWQVPICDASNIQFKCPIPPWFEMQCSASCQ